MDVGAGNEDESAIFNKGNVMTKRSTTKTTATGGVKSSFVLYPDVRVAIQKLRREWSFTSTSETIRVAVLFLSQASNNGLKRIQLDECPSSSRD